MSEAVEGAVAPVVESAPVIAASVEGAPSTEPKVEAAPTEVEPAAKDSTPQDAEDKKYASKFAALARREKQIKAQERELQAKIQKMQEAAKTPAESKVEEVPLEHRLKRNPLQTLKELGLSYETLTQIALNDGKLTPEIEMAIMREELTKTSRSEIEELKAQIEADRKERREKEEQAAKAQEEAAVESYKQQISDYVAEKASELELLSAEGENASELVWEVINKHYEETFDDENGKGEILSVEKAAEAVEAHLLEEAKKRIKLDKIKKLLEASAPQQQTPTTKQVAQQKASVTLSNDNSQVQSTKKSYLSDEESKAEVAKLLVWKED